MDAAAISRSSAREQAQNHRITRVIKQATRTALRVASVAQTLGNLDKVVAANGQKLVDLTTLVNGIDGRLKGIEAVAPTILDALTKLGTAYPAVEYGRAGIFVSGAATPTLAAGGTVTSADIPDDGNAITTGEDAIVVAGAGGLMAIDLKAAIRSNESDGKNTSDTAGQAGGYLFVVDNDTGVRVACGGTPNPPGVIGTTAGDPIVTPSGTVNTLPLKNIPGGVARTDTAKPDSSSTSLLPAACQFAAAAGHTYEVHYSVNFVDIPTSTSPGPAE
jgi:hypothetical protein